MIINNEDNLFIIKIYKENIDNFDVFDIDNVTDIFKDILIKIKKKYNISGLCDIDVYVNYDFGMIIEINNVYKYSEDIDVKIKFHIDSYFMNEVYFNFEDINLYDSLYYYNNKYYTKYNNNFDSNIIYKECNDIMNNGIRIR